MNRSDSNRILLVGDEPASHSQFRRILLGQGSDYDDVVSGASEQIGWGNALQIDAASRGEDGWECVRQALAEYRPYTLAVVDLHMPPGWDGIETIRRIRDIDPELLILLCLDNREEASESVSQQLGGPEWGFFIAKPFVPAHLRQLVDWQTQHLKLREELHQTTLQLESAEQTIRRLHEEVEQAGSLRDRAVSDRQYGLRATMHAVLGISEVLMKEPLCSGQLQRLECIHGAGESLLRLVEEFVDAGSRCSACGACHPADTARTDEQRLLEGVKTLRGEVHGRPVATGGAVPGGPPTREDTRPPARYLIVDDEEICRELLTEMLRPWGKCDVARDGEEAIETFRRARDEGHSYDLVCLDIMMPGLNGHEVLERIRAQETEEGLYGPERTRVIMTTALADSKHLLQAFRNGCEAYVVKPFTQNDILTAIRRFGLAAVPCEKGSRR
jgi:two-component system chemotaxis response regulator CheY